MHDIRLNLSCNPNISPNDSFPKVRFFPRTLEVTWLPANGEAPRPVWRSAVAQPMVGHTSLSAEPLSQWWDRFCIDLEEDRDIKKNYPYFSF